MRAWLGSLAGGRSLELATALAVGWATFALAQSAAGVVTHVLGQHVGSNPFGDDAGFESSVFNAPYLLSFDVGGTRIFYGQVVAALLTLGLVGLVAGYVVRRRERELGECPHCASRIPRESTHCAYCGTGVEPGRP
jgi:hypothetical protein